MAIAVRTSTWDPFTSLARQLDAEFENLTRSMFGATPRGGFAPATDVYRDGDDLLVTVELPGVDVDKDVDVELTEGRLSISGSRAEIRKADEGVLLREIRTGRFQREFTLPEGVTAEQLEATYDRGLLQVRVKDISKRASGPTKVQVRSASGPTEVAGEIEDSTGGKEN
jgi:HSP20 family protein